MVVELKRHSASFFLEGTLIVHGAGNEFFPFGF
jgi:hypothetical protein